MADKFPSTFVDAKTGEIERFDTLFDRVQDAVPDAAHYGLLAAKVSLLAPMIGGAIVALPATVALWWGTRWTMKKGIDAMHDKLMQAHRQGEFSEYDLTSAADKAAFETRFGALHPQLADDFLLMAKMAKLGQIPKLLIIEPYFGEQGRSKFAGMISDFMAAATSRPSGKDPVVMLGRGALHELKPEEMRAVIGHEFTHIKLGHMKETANWLGRFSLNSVINAGLFVAALVGAAPILPVIGLIAVTNMVGTCLKSIQSRRHEELCDRGAALLTGGTGDLTSALSKIRAAMLKIKKMEIEEELRSRGLDPTNVQVKERGGWKRFVHASHPTNERREQLLTAFEKKHETFCREQRGKFKTAFNNAARPPARAPEAPPAPKTFWVKFPKLKIAA